jgi:hypothetical protein
MSLMLHSHHLLSSFACCHRYRYDIDVAVVSAAFFQGKVALKAMPMDA